MDIQVWLLRGHTCTHARKLYLRDGRKDKGKVQSLRKEHSEAVGTNSVNECIRWFLTDCLFMLEARNMAVE